MFETVTLHTRVEADGHLRVDLPLDLPPDSELKVTVALNPKRRLSEEEWRAQARRIVGSIPDIERPDDPPPRDIEPL